MRISDWSSDVCSSDLNIGSGRPTDPEIAGWLDGLGGLLPDIPVAIVADRDDGPSILEALRRGVRAYIPTSLSLPVMVEALRLVCAGGTFVPATSFAGSLRHPADGPETPPVRKTADLDGFTPRQREVLELLRKGKPNKIIAYEPAMQRS